MGRLLLVSCITLLLVACGGGGSSGSSTPPSVTTPPVTPPTTPDTTAPVVELSGASTLNHEQGTPFEDPGATASDNVDASVTVIVSGEVDPQIAATYVLTYSATDNAGNEDSVQRTVIVADTTPPEISLTGEAVLTLIEGDVFDDPGAVATDLIDGAVAVVTEGTVSAAPGTYTLTYTATDSANNQQIVTRTVTVEETPPVVPPPVTADTTAPVVALIGASTINHEQGTAFEDPGATASDNVDASVSVVVSGEVDPDEGGTYVVTYSAADSAGNSDSVQRTVVVADTTPPEISLVGEAMLTVIEGEVFDDPGAVATDLVDGAVNVVAEGTIDAAPGDYTLTYTAIDSASNRQTITRTVTVKSANSNNSSNDLLVFQDGVVGDTWNLGINAFDEALNYGECNNDGGAGCPSIDWSVEEDPNRGPVLQVTHAVNGGLAGLFFSASAGVDITNYSEGAIEFDIRVVSGDSAITMKLDCFFPCTSGDQILGSRGANGWETVTIPVSQLATSGLNVKAVNTGLVIWATAHNGTVFQLDRVRFTGYDENATPPSSVDYQVTTMGVGSYSDTINPASYRCVYDFGNWIYNAGVVEPAIDYCDTSTGTPTGVPRAVSPQLAGAAANEPTMTHRWWGSVSFLGEMTVGDPNKAAYITPDPIIARVTERGVRMMGIPGGLATVNAVLGGFGYPIPDPFSEVFDGLAVANSLHTNLEGKLIDHSDGAITVGWFSDTTEVMTATFVYGSPYVYFSVASGQPIIRTLRADSAEKGVFHEGDNSVGIWTDVAGNRNNFLIVGDDGTSFSDVESNAIGVNSPTGQFTVAWLQQDLADGGSTAWDFLTANARQVVSQVNIDYAVDRSTNTVTVTHSYLDAADQAVTTVAGLMPLQWKRVSELVANATTRSARGVIKFSTLSEFSYEMSSIGVLPALPLIPNTVDVARLTAQVNAFMDLGPAAWNPAEDTYWSGKRFGRAAEVIAIATQLGMDEEAATLHTWLKTQLADWFTAETLGDLDTSQYFVYDPAWSTLLGLEESFGSHQMLNDHHFHYGYFVRAAAEICRTEPAWCGSDQYGPMVELLIRDYAAGRGDPMFPYVRNFDPANGFSWASGPANFARGNNNESTSEAANAYGSVVLYGLITGNEALVDRGLYLHASTAAAFWEYWNDIDGYRGVDPEKENFPPDYNRITTSIVWGEGSAFSTWFSPAFAHILGIQALPVNPLIMHVALHADYLVDYVALGLEESANGRPSGLPEDQWRDLWWMLWSMTNPDAAISDYESVDSYNPEQGEAPPHTLHWLYTMQELGQLATGTGTLTADYPGAMAFTANGVTSYVVYNFGEAALTVTFSDSTTVVAQPGAFAIEKR